MLVCLAKAGTADATLGRAMSVDVNKVPNVKKRTILLFVKFFIFLPGIGKEVILHSHANARSLLLTLVCRVTKGRWVEVG